MENGLICSDCKLQNELMTSSMARWGHDHLRVGENPQRMLKATAQKMVGRLQQPFTAAPAGVLVLQYLEPDFQFVIGLGVVCAIIQAT